MKWKNEEINASGYLILISAILFSTQASFLLFSTQASFLLFSTQASFPWRKVFSYVKLVWRPNKERRKQRQSWPQGRLAPELGPLICLLEPNSMVKQNVLHSVISLT